MTSFAERYGPWAVIAGASEGTGREFARQIAAHGVNLVMVARRAGPLAELAQTITAESGVECLTLPTDLAQHDAAGRIVAAVGDRQVGLYVSNAGADPNGSHFLDAELAAWEELVARNVLTTLRCVHAFGRAMRERGRGGILLAGSGACYGSGPNLAVYSGVKAFDLRFAEGLWAELGPGGVDVLYLAMTSTDTPAHRNLAARRGLPLRPNLADAAAVARLGLERLPHGPVCNWGLADDEAGWAERSAAERRERVRAVAEASRTMFGSKAG